MLLIAARELQAPDDPGPLGLWGIVALLLLLALVVAHLRVLRAVARQLDAGPAGRPFPESGYPQQADARPEHAAR